jgi:6-phosphogluconolactonase (cycloisomerase 2 family)
MNRKIVMTLIAAGILLGSGSATLAEDDRGQASPGAVYTMGNDPAGNQVVIFDRDEDGLLTLAGAVATDGLGSGGGLDPLASQNSIVLSENKRWLLAVNAGSNDISVFRVRPDGPVLTDRVGSGGTLPVSLAVYHNQVYVLNAGGTANISGFYLTNRGRLVPLANAARDVGTGRFSQVGFDPQGDNLVVTDRGDNEILVYPLDERGLPDPSPVTSPSSGIAPFGFIFDEQGHLLVAEAGSGAVSSYAIEEDGTLTVISASVANGQVATCWIAGNQQGYVYTSNTGSQNLSAYQVGKEDNDAGQLELLDATAAFGNRPIDNGVSINGRFLYALDPAAAAIDMFAIEADGSLTDLGTAPGGLALFAQGIAVR